MKRLFLTLLLVSFWVSAALAQTTTYTPNLNLALPPAAPNTWGADYNNNFVILDSATGAASLPRVTFANLPTSPTTNQAVVLIDALTSTSCSAGGGTAEHICQWNGTTWTAISGGGDLSGALTISSDITPPQITGNQDNYNPTGLSTASVLRLSTDVSRNITGIVGGSDGRLLLIHNIGNFDVVLVNNSGSSSVGNKFLFGNNITLASNQGIILQYDSTSQVWRAATAVTTGGGGAPTDATYITQTPNGSLSSEQALSLLATGLMKVTTSTGVISSVTDSAGLAGALSDETGSGAAVFASSPTITTPTITTPTIASFASATHNHTNAAGGGQITDAALSSQVTVAKGGTGQTTLTNHGVLLGQGSSAVVSPGLGTSGQVLTSNGAAADPTFQTPATANNTPADFAFTGDITPPQITSDQDNYNPANLSTASVIRISTDTLRNITGLSGGADGRIMFIYNIGSNSALLVSESTNSTAANRFSFNSNISLAAAQGVLLQYDSTSTRWRAAGAVSGGGGVGNDLIAIEALTGTGVARRTGVDTWALSDPTASPCGAGSAPRGLNADLTPFGCTAYQANDTELTALAGLTSAADTGMYFTGSGTAGTYSITSFSRGVLAGAAATNWRTSLSLVPGTDVQVFSARLSEIAALTPTNNTVFGSSGTTNIAYGLVNCPSGPVTYTASNHSFACGSFPAGTISGTSGTLTKFTGSNAVGNSVYGVEDANGIIITGQTRLGTTGTNDLAYDYTGVTGNKSRVIKNVTGDEAVTTGVLTNGHVAVFDASGRIVDGGAAGSITASSTDTFTNKSMSGSTNTFTNLPVSSVVAVLKTRLIQFIIGADNGNVLADTDDQQTVFANRLGQGIHITEVWCESDGGTPSINIQKDDGTPADVLSSNLSCSSSGASSTTFAAGEDAVANGDRLDFVMVSAGGTAKRVTVSVKYTLD